MSRHYPRIRMTCNDGSMGLREALVLTFHLGAPHSAFAPQMLQALERYVTTITPEFLTCVDEDGRRQPLDDNLWVRLRSETLTLARVELVDVDLEEERYGFTYVGGIKPGAFERGFVSEMHCWFPTEYLEKHGPAHLRAVALEMLGSLPITSGNLGLALRYLGHTPPSKPNLGELVLRFPGFTNYESVSEKLGGRVRDISWMTFLGQPALGQVGGVAGLRSRLHSPGTVVDELPGDRAVITLGEWPEAGDMAEGKTLPNYRELARVLEPVLYREPWEHWAWEFDTAEDLRRVERRFLDP